LYFVRDALVLDGWWHTAFRVGPDTFIVRTDEPPRATTVIDDLAAALSAQGLGHVADDLPTITALAYAQLSLGTGVSWALWARDRAAGEATLAARVDPESSLQAAEPGVLDPEGAMAMQPVVDLSAELEGARRMAGVPESVIVAVGLDDAVVNQLRPAIPECRLETLPLETALGACGMLSPALVLVNAADRAGKEFIMEFRADACGRFLPVVAVTSDELPLGADEVLDPGDDPPTWVQPLRRLLP
jgi:hypothetical protein